MKFNVQLLAYEADDSWVEGTIKDLKACLDSDECPEHAQTGYGPKGDKQCECLTFLEGIENI